MVLFSPAPDLHTPRLSGRAPGFSDGRLLARVWRNAKASRYLSASGAPWTRRRVRLAQDRLIAHWGAHSFGPRLWFHQGRFVCYAGLKFAQIDHTPVVEIMWGAPPHAWGHGFVTEAAAASLLEPLGFDCVVSVALPENTRSLAVMARLGFAPMGVFTHVGLPHLRYSLTLDSDVRAQLRCLAGA